MAEIEEGEQIMETTPSVDLEVLTPSVDSPVQAPALEAPVKRGRGRPKGSGKKAVETSDVAKVTENTAKAVQKAVNADPSWIPTRTSFGTPVWIKYQIKVGDTIEFMVVTDPDRRSFETTVHSDDLFKPILPLEREHEFDGITFYDPSKVRVVEPIVEDVVQEADETSEVPQVEEIIEEKLNEVQ